MDAWRLQRGFETPPLISPPSSNNGELANEIVADLGKRITWGQSLRGRGEREAENGRRVQRRERVRRDYSGGQLEKRRSLTGSKVRAEEGVCVSMRAIDCE